MAKTSMDSQGKARVLAAPTRKWKPRMIWVTFLGLAQFLTRRVLPGMSSPAWRAKRAAARQQATCLRRAVAPTARSRPQEASQARSHGTKREPSSIRNSALNQTSISEWTIMKILSDFHFRPWLFHVLLFLFASLRAPHCLPQAHLIRQKAAAVLRPRKQLARAGLRQTMLSLNTGRKKESQRLK